MDTYKVAAINFYPPLDMHLQRDYDYLIQKVVDDTGILKYQPYEKVFGKETYK